MGLNSNVNSVAISNDLKFIVIGAIDHSVKIYETDPNIWNKDNYDDPIDFSHNKKSPGQIQTNNFDSLVLEQTQT